MSELTISLPTSKLADSVRALLSDDELSRIELFTWDMAEPSTRTHIDLVVPPYAGSASILPRLASVTTRLVQGQSIGWDDVPSALPAGHIFANAATVHETATAELAVALTLASQRRLDEYARNQTSATWKPRFSPSLADRRVVLLGYGGVGKAIAARLAGFEVDIVAVASRARNEDGVPVHGIDSLAELLPETDVLIASLPGGDTTRHIIDADALALLPDGALIVNVGRGSLIDPAALYAQTSSGRLRAALDVTEPEPLKADDPLWGVPGVIITPHVGGSASSMTPRISSLIVRQIRHLLAGEVPENIVLRS